MLESGPAKPVLMCHDFSFVLSKPAELKYTPEGKGASMCVLSLSVRPDFLVLTNTYLSRAINIVFRPVATTLAMTTCALWSCQSSEILVIRDLVGFAMRLPDPQILGNLFQGLALRSHLATELLAVRSRIPNPSTNPLPNQVTLKLRDC